MNKSELRQIIKEEIKLILNEVKYDFSYNKEKIYKKLKYKGYNIKIANISSGRFGNMYYGIADSGEPLMDNPSHFQTPEEAEKNIKKEIDGWE